MEIVCCAGFHLCSAFYNYWPIIHGTFAPKLSILCGYFKHFNLLNNNAEIKIFIFIELKGQRTKSIYCGGRMSTAMATPQQQQPSPDNDRLYQWIVELSNPDIRENALLELSKKRESVHDLAPMLWHSFGTIASLLQA